MRDRYYFAAYSGGECIIKCQGTNMKVITPNTTNIETKRTITDATTTIERTITVTEPYISVNYIDDNGNPQQVTLSANAVWTLERGT